MFYVVLIGAVVALLHMVLTLYVVTHKNAKEEDIITNTNYINNGTHWTSKGTCFHKKPNFEFRFLRGLYIDVPTFNYAGYGTQGGANSSPTGDLYIEWSLYEYDEEY